MLPQKLLKALQDPWVWKLGTKMSKNLKEISVEESSVERIAEKALKDSAFATNPRTASLEEMVNLINVSMNKGR